MENEVGRISDGRIVKNVWYCQLYTHGSAEQKKNREIGPFNYAQSILDKSQKIATIPNAGEDEK